MSNLNNQLVKQETEEVARGIRLLLAKPLLTAADDDGFELVRRRRDPIVKWFDYYCGWRAHVEPRLGYARLSKVTDRPDPSRPARRLRSSRAPFDRRRYTLLCVAAAELLAAPVTTIGLLADRMVQATAAEAELPTFDPTRRDERSAYVDSLKWLERCGAIRPVDGSTESYLDHADAKVLYQIDTTLLVRLLAAPVPPSRLDEQEVAALLAESRYGDAPNPDAAVSDNQRNLWLRHSVMRRLVDDPVVYRADLTPAQLGYLASPTGRRIISRGIQQAGCILEERCDGYLVIDPDAIATDTKFPDDGSHPKVAALLLLDKLNETEDWLPADQLALVAAELLDRFRSWGKAYRSDEGAKRLAHDAVEILRAFGLAERRYDGATRARPAAARYAVERIRTDEAGH
ncbi:TIGR02678 family protein [Saccharopolyspora sp. NPDC000995]